MRIRNISLRVVSLLVLTFVFVVATAVFTLFDIRMQTQNMEDSLAEEARTFAREMDAVWEFMDNSQHTINNTTTGVYEFKGLHCAIVGKSVGAIFSAGKLLHPLHELRAAPGSGQARCLRNRGAGPVQRAKGHSGVLPHCERRPGRGRPRPNFGRQRRRAVPLCAGAQGKRELP